MLHKGNSSLVDKSVVFLSDALKVKLRYDLSTASTRKQSLHFFYQVLSKMQSLIKSSGPAPWQGWNRTGFPAAGACPASSRLHSLLLFSDWWRCQLVPAVVWCYENLSREDQRETKLPSGDTDRFTEPIDFCKDGGYEIASLTRHACVS